MRPDLSQERPLATISGITEDRDLSGRRKILWAVSIVAAIALVFLYGQIDVATKSIEFDLRKIGESLYEARFKTGKWPAEIADLEGTEYLKMPHRKALLENGLFVVMWQQDLDPNPEANRNRVLAYDNGSLLSRFGSVLVCRGDLRIERMKADDVRPLNPRGR